MLNLMWISVGKDETVSATSKNNQGSWLNYTHTGMEVET